MTSIAPRTRTVLLAGVHASSVAARFPEIDAVELEKHLNASFDELNATPNLKVTICWLYLEDEQPALRIADALKGNTFDGVLIGWGVRGLPENSALFEHAIDIVRKNVPLDTKLIFSATANDHLIAISRNFPDITAA